MSDNKNKNSKRDLANSSAVLRDDNASAKQRGIAGQNLANHRWLIQMERELSKARQSSSRGSTRAR